MLHGLVDTKKECVEFLQDALAVPIAERIYKMYLECQKKGLKQFQIELSKISKWNNHTIEDEARQIIEKSQCSYLQKILKTTITTCVKIKFSEYKKKLNHINIKIPDVLNFIHKCFINTANYAWKHTYLFVQSNIRQIEIQNNMNIFEHNTRKAVSKTITQYIIVEDIFDQLNELIEKNKKKKVYKQKPNYESPIDDTNDDNEGSDEDIVKNEQEGETVDVDDTSDEDAIDSIDVIDDSNAGNESNESNASNERDIVHISNEGGCNELVNDDGNTFDKDECDHDDGNVSDHKNIDECDQNDGNEFDQDECDQGDSNESYDENIDECYQDEENELISDSVLNNKNEYSIGFKSDSESDEEISDSESVESEKSFNNNDIKVVKINDVKPKKLSFF